MAADPWWRIDAQERGRLTDRISSVYVERCHIDRDENSVLVVNRQETVRIPAAMLAVLLIGPGTRATHAAVALLSDSGTSVCWVGEQGVRMYASGFSANQRAHLVNQQAWLVSRRMERLRVAREMYAIRFPGDTDIARLNMQQLRGREGSRVRAIYKRESARTGVAWTTRQYRAGNPDSGHTPVNLMLSAANAALYGVVHAAVVGIGASPALGFVHTGIAISFVLDIADLYKAEITIPLAFDLVAAGKVEERDARLGVRDLVSQTRLMPRIISDVQRLLRVEEADESAVGANELWDDSGSAVAGGVNWADRDIVGPDEVIELIGPDFTEEPTT